MKKINNKKGFTLIELLAVIVILAIILAIAIPGMTDSINTNRANAFKASAKMIISEVDKQDIMNSMQSGGVALRTCNATPANSVTGTSANSLADYPTLGINLDTDGDTLTVTGDYDSSSSNSFVCRQSDGKIYIKLKPGNAGKFKGTSTLTGTRDTLQ